MEKQVLTCIRCPRGCQVELTLENGKITGVTGNSCKRGELYAKAELTNPVRTVTSTVVVDGAAEGRMVSVKTATEVPKAKVRDVMDAIFSLRAQAPVHIGDILCKNIADTGVDLVATKDIA